MNPVKQSLRNRAASKDDLLDTINREVIPVLSATRELTNRLAANPEQPTTGDVDWASAHFRAITLTGPTTLSFIAPGGAAWLALRVTQDATGGHVVTWPASVLWESGLAAVITIAAGAKDLILFYFDGTNYFGLPAQDFS